MKHLHSILSLGFLLIILACNSNAQTVQETVDANSFERGILENEVQVLDVRTPEEFNQGHLANAMLANWNEKDEFNRRIDALDKNQPVYIYCLSGGRSAGASSLLVEKGFTKVIELKGGIKSWKQADKPIEGEIAVDQISNDSYQAMLSSASLVFVDFGAKWCPPCRRMEPILEELETENPSVPLIRIDAGSQTALMKVNDVLELPTYILYKDGKEVWRASGLMEKGKISNAINQFKGK